MTSPNPNRNPRLGKTYKVGSSGARVVWRDGTVTTYPAHRVVTFSELPRRIEGRLYRVSRVSSRLGYETPALESS